jgi:hypothetical protein
MAEEVNINISITTNAAPAADKITKELDGVKRKAKEVKDELAEAFDQPAQGDGKIKQGTKDVEALKNTLQPIKGLINDLTGGMSDAFFQAYQSVKAATDGVKGLDLALKTAAFGIAILVIQSLIDLYDELTTSAEEEEEALKKADEAKKQYIETTRQAADAIDKERKARDGASNEIKREIAELEASGAASEMVYAKRKELLNQELQDLIAKQAFLYDDAEAQKQISQDILDKQSALRALDLSEDKRVREEKAAAAKQAKADRERERQEEFNRLNEIIVRNNYWADELAKAVEKGNEAVRARGQFAVQLLEFYQDQIQELQDQETWAEEERKIRQARARKAESDAAEKARQDELAKEKAYRQSLQDLAVDSALGTIGALKELNGIYDQTNKEASERAFNRNKALSIAETIVSTYAAAQKAYTSQLIIGDPTSVVRAQIAAAVAVAGGLARVAAIGAQKFTWSDSQPSNPSINTAAAVGGGSVPAPQFNIVGQSGTNQLAQSIGGQFNQPIRAYVVGQDVTTAQQLERQRVRTATFG